MKHDLTAAVSRALGPGGSCALSVPDFEPRAEQIEYATRIARLLDRAATPGAPKIALLQGSTGVGKTMGYLVPALSYAIATGRRVAVATHSIDLLLSLPAQVEDVKRALVREHGAEAVRRITVALRVGRPEYLSAAAISARLACAPDAATRRTLDSLLRHAVTVGVYRLWDGELPEGLSWEALVLDDDADEQDQAVYRRDIERSAQAQLLLCTQASLVLAGMGRSNVLLPAGEPPVSLLVVDEADTLPGMAETITRNYVPLRQLRTNFEALGRAQAAIEALDQLIRAVAALLRDGQTSSYLATAAESAYRPMVGERIGQLLQAAEPVLKGRRSAVVRELRSDLARLASSGAAFRGESSYGLPYIRHSEVRGYPAIGMADPRPGAIVGRLMANAESQQLCHVVFTSATLTPVAGEQLAGFGRDLLLPPVEEDICGAVEPEKFGTLRFVFTAPGVEPPHDGGQVNAQWLAHLGRLVTAAAAAGERVLVLTPSYADGQRLLPLISGLGDRLALQTREPGSRASCLERFKGTPGTVWVSPSSWEGVDLPGLVRNLVVARLPYPSTDTNQLAARRHQSLRSGRSEAEANAHAHILARAVCMRRLSQGIGRAIRRHNDHATVWFGDPRMGLPTALAESLLEQGLIPTPATAQGFLSVIPKRHLASLRRSGQVRAMTSDGAIHP